MFPSVLYIVTFILNCCSAYDIYLAQWNMSLILFLFFRNWSSILFWVLDGLHGNRHDTNTDEPTQGPIADSRLLPHELISSLPNHAGSAVGSSSPSAFAPIRHINKSLLTPLAFCSSVVGRNICLSPDCTVAVRRVEDYCNAYVFTPRPLRIRETIVVQVLSVDPAYTGGLAFGVTCCNPDTLRSEMLPDDADLLLDRPEYWVVNKDVCAKAQVADELTFYLTEDGEFCWCVEADSCPSVHFLPTSTAEACLNVVRHFCYDSHCITVPYNNNNNYYYYFCYY